MKRILLALLAVVLFAQSNAQMSAFQRLAFGPLDMVIAANSASASVKSFCYDAVRSAPRGLSDYKNVLADGETALSFGGAAPIALQEALNRGWIELEGGLQGITFKNKSDQPVRMLSKTGSLLGDKPSDRSEISRYILSLLTDGDIQNKVWDERSKLKVLNEEGLLPSLDLEAQDVKAAESKYKEKHNLATQSEVKSSIRRASYDIEEQERIRPKKVRIYEYKKLISNGNPSKEELKKADEIYFKDVNDKYEQSSKLDNDFQHLQDEIFVLQKENLLASGDPSIDELINAEATAQKQWNLQGEALEDEFIKRSWQYRNEQYNTEDLLYSFSDNTKDNLKTFEKALGLSETGDVTKSKALSALSFYYENVYPLVRSKVKTPEDFISEVKAFKSSVGLNTEFALNDATTQFFSDLKNQFTSQSAGKSTILGQYPYKGNIYFSGYADKGYVVTSYDPQTKQFTKALTTGEPYGIYVDKINSDLYLVAGDITEVGNLYPTVEKHSYYQDDIFEFGNNLTDRDKQSLLSTQKFRRITARKDLHFGNSRITSRLYDFSAAPRITQSESYLLDNAKDLTLTISPKQQVPRGSGLVGKIIFKFYDVANQTVSFVKSGVSEIFTRMRANTELDFADELRKKLGSRINISDVDATMTHMEVAIQFIKSDLDGTYYCFVYTKH